MIVDSLVIEAATVGEPRVVLAKGSGRKKSYRMGGQATSIELDSVKIQEVVAETPVWTVASGASWVSLVTQSGQGVGVVRWQNNFAQLPIGMHVDSIVVSLASDPSVRAVYLDSVQVIEVVEPEPTAAARQLFAGGGGLSTDQRSALDDLGNQNGQYDLGDFLAWVSRSNVTLSTSVMAELEAAVSRGELDRIASPEDRQETATLPPRR
jgi:hypothetical protein